MTLIASGWLAAHGRSGKPNRAAAIIGGVNAVNMAALLSLGVYATRLDASAALGFPAENYFFLAGMAGLAVVADASLLVRRDVSDRHRIARHLWRMCFGFFIAAGSAFTGPGASAFPDWLRESGVLSAPELIIMILMIFWLVRTLRH